MSDKPNLASRSCNCAKADGERQGWRVLDTQGGRVCEYSSLVQGGQWRVELED